MEFDQNTNFLSLDFEDEGLDFDFDEFDLGGDEGFLNDAPEEFEMDKKEDGKAEEMEEDDSEEESEEGFSFGEVEKLLETEKDTSILAGFHSQGAECDEITGFIEEEMKEIESSSTFFTVNPSLEMKVVLHRNGKGRHGCPKEIRRRKE